MGRWNKLTYWLYDTREAQARWCMWNRVVRWFYFTKEALFSWLHPDEEADNISNQVDNALEIHKRQTEEVVSEIKKTGENVREHLRIAEEAIDIARRTKFINNNVMRR